MAAVLIMIGMDVSSCSNENDIKDVETSSKKIQLTLTASFEAVDGGSSRAVWDTSVKPKFQVGDKIGVYSTNQTTAEPITVTAVDNTGNATLNGTVTAASEYHLVFPYKAGTTYDTSTGDISGFDDFNVTTSTNDGSFGTYPTTALHYAKTTSGNSIFFYNLCAILKVCNPNTDYYNNNDDFLITFAYVGNPIIHTTGTAYVTATYKSLDVYLRAHDDDENSTTTYYHYYPVAPGNVTIVSTISNERKTATTVANKIYWLHGPTY